MKLIITTTNFIIITIIIMSFIFILVCKRFIIVHIWIDLQIKWIGEDNENDCLKIDETNFFDKKKGNYKKPKDKKKNIQTKKEN